ncbi:MAG: 50S ribosomal protein L23 [Deltaproteobacteria bacterium]|nr:MAG: 50S ribosomal protein L23 [Deltaproteobacteria bacterium]
MELKDILVRPIVTEKTTVHLGNDNTYAFEVNLKANKNQVKHAIEQYYGVSVADVRTLVMRGKVKRFGRHHSKRSNWKKAYVTLADGESINIFEA